MGKIYTGACRCVSELTFESTLDAANPFSDIELDVTFSNTAGHMWRVPAFWSGGSTWRVRFAPPETGDYKFATECSRADDIGLHGISGDLSVTAYTGSNNLMTHGPIRISEDKRHFEHEDGAPFFWLGDTWWMGLTKRLAWPHDFQKLAADRTEKGYTVVQIVAGLYPDMPWGDERGWNEAGMPYSDDFGEVRPAYFDAADLKMEHIVSQGMVPCIVGSWAYFLMWMGIEKAKKHWRYLIARWGAWPVVWCVAGEGKMPYYLSEDPAADSKAQQTGWTEIARYIHATDPMQHPVTIHPTSSSRDQVDDASVLDFEMLQTGHGNLESIPGTVAAIRDAYVRKPPMPVINSEVNYEGIMSSNYDDVQRLAFWCCMLGGAAGHTYGANGIWQVNTADKSYGPSPHGNNWGTRPWDDAMGLPGSTHVAIGKKILETFRWWEFQPHQEWVNPASNSDDWLQPFAAGIPGVVRVIYTFRPVWGRGVSVVGIEPDIKYSARFVNPSDGAEHALGTVVPDDDGNWLVPQQPEMRDWVLILERLIS